MTRNKAWRTVFSQLVLAGFLAGGAHAQIQPPKADAAPRSLLVEMTNKSRSIKCAEDDNVTIEIRNRGVKSFSIEALNPAYAKDITVDNLDPNWAGCDMSKDPKFEATSAPKREVMYEDDKVVVYGITQPSFWRPLRAVVKVAGKEDAGLHLLQVFVKHDGRQSEIAVMYPQDGYWRMKALPPTHLPDTGFGSSFLIGPVEHDQRPVVNLTEVVFDPGSMTYRLAFAAGGSAVVKIAGYDTVRTKLDITLDGVNQKDKPFTVLRSMFVEKGNGDVESAWWIDGTGDTKEANIMKFDATARDVRFGRAEKWNRNTSAPDMRFYNFR